MLDAAAILDASILIVDDQDDNLQLLERMLRDAGYSRIACTTDPQAVCALHRSEHYDLILLDLQMPVMDGFEVMQGLRETTDGYLPVMVITGQPDHKLRALQAGARDFISKPFDLVEMTTRIHNMLEVRLLYQQIENHNKLLELTVLARTAELRDSEARFRRLTELAADWYWEQDVDGRFTKVFGPVFEMLGIQDDSLLNETLGSPGAAGRAALAANMAARQPFLDFVYRRVTPAGALQYLQVSGEPMFDAAGRFTGYRGIGRDVTDSMRPSAIVESALP